MTKKSVKFKNIFGSALVLTMLSINIFQQKVYCLNNENKTGSSWYELTDDPQYSLSQSFRFYRLRTNNGSLASLVVLDLKDNCFRLTPFFNKGTKTVSSTVTETRSLAGINGGFFNLSNGESTSYVIIDGQNQCDPKKNKALVENPELIPYLNTIFNRSEFRILEDTTGKRKACIAAHNDQIPSGWILVHSIQAGPQLLPSITTNEEAFVRKTSKGNTFDSIGTNKNFARTAVGITKDNHVLFLAVADKKQDQFSPGITLDELAKIMQDLGCIQALNCDGGTSTTMVIAQGDLRDELNYVTHKIIAQNPEKQVKSGLIIQKNTKKSLLRYTSGSLPR